MPCDRLIHVEDREGQHTFPKEACMKSRLTLIFAALVVLLGAMAMLVRDRSAVVPAPAMAILENDSELITPPASGAAPTAAVVAPAPAVVPAVVAPLATAAPE